MNIGEKLKQARLDKKMKLKDVAKVTNLSISYISDIENNNSIPPVDTLTNLCSALDLSIYSILSEPEDMMLMEKNINVELYELIKDFNEWDKRDQKELLTYLKVKKTARSELGKVVE